MRSRSRKIPTLSANRLPVGTATRLSAGLQSNQQLHQRHLRTSSSLGSSVLNTELTVEDRPNTGILGIKSTTSKSSLQFRRQIEDRNYYVGLLREHINAISGEMKNIITEYSIAEEEAKSFGQYEKMAENLAAELRDLQGELGDYNTLLDKATLGSDIFSIELDWEDLKAANDRAEVCLEHHFEELKKKEDQLKSVQLELEQEKRIAECIVEDMNSEQSAKYLKLRDQNDYFLEQISIRQCKLSELSERRRELEMEISISEIKKEALCILSKLRKVEAERDQLEPERYMEDPQIEKERLLAKIKEDNRETAKMEREIHELNERIYADEALFNQLNIHVRDEPINEQNKMNQEPKHRKTQEGNFSSFNESAVTDEPENPKPTEDQIDRALDRCSQYIVNIERTIGGKAATETNVDNLDAKADQLNAKCKLGNTARALNAERSKLLGELLMIDQLEMSMAEELEALKTKVTSMEVDLKVFNDVCSNHETSEERKASLMKELEKLKETRENLTGPVAQLEAQCTALKVKLNSNDTHIELCALEKKLKACKERKKALSESIETRKYLSDFSSTAMKAKSLVADYNEALTTALKVKPIGF